VCHVVHHGLHVVISGPHQIWSEHDRQILRFHLVDIRIVDDVAQMKHDVLERVVIVRRQTLDQPLQLLQSRLGVLDLVGFDETRIQRAGHQGVRNLPEVRLQQTADDVEVVPTGVVDRHPVVVLVDLLRQRRYRRVVPGDSVDPQRLQTPSVDDVRADLDEFRNVGVGAGGQTLVEGNTESRTFGGRGGAGGTRSVHLAELLGHAAAPRLHFGTGVGVAYLGGFASFTHGRLARGGAIAGGGGFGFGGLGGKATVALDQNRGGGGDRLGHGLLLGAGRLVLKINFFVTGDY
jgi:hypothetical protein